MTPEKLHTTVRHDVSLLSDDDLHYFNEGTYYNLYEKLGGHPLEIDDRHGTCYAVWAPNASSVAVMGDFNGWQKDSHLLKHRGQSGIWEGWIPDAGKGTQYKFFIESAAHGYSAEKTDPFAFYMEVAPKTASIVWDLEYEWQDHEWMLDRGSHNGVDHPISIYEIHIGSWKHEEDGHSLSYRDLADKLVEYVLQTGFTHVEFLPVMEHPFYGSWGYQCLGYYAPTSRFGSPQDFMYLVDTLHRNEIGVIIDWVPSHFPTDEVGLGYFDGTHLYEHADPRKGVHPDWGSYVFNYGRNEVRNFLISNALFWLEKYHVDGLRVDAVTSMLYLDYSRKEGEWIPNRWGRRENEEAILFLRRLNEVVYSSCPGAQTFAEESTSWPMVSRPTSQGGLGFGFKWDMGWMHDALEYFTHEPVHRKFHHNNLTFRMIYAFAENFMLPLSHDEVVHGKGSLIGKMPGDEWQRFANLRLLYGYMYAQPGKKLVFMGGEFAQIAEWNHDTSLDWKLLQSPTHKGILNWLTDLNHTYRNEKALHEQDINMNGFEWVDCNDREASTLSFLRWSVAHNEVVLAVFNFTLAPRHDYRIGVPRAGHWKETLNSDAEIYGGTNLGNSGGLDSEPEPCHGHGQSLCLTLPPLAALFLKQQI
jgi:1,4-alpha-glucan branching enzyme